MDVFFDSLKGVVKKVPPQKKQRLPQKKEVAAIDL